MPELIFYQRGQPLLRFPLGRGDTKIGRGAECDLTLAGDSLSRVQLLLIESENNYFAKNVGKAPLSHNGKPVGSTSLKEGDRLVLAEWEIEFSSKNDVSWNQDETYASRAGKENTRLLNVALSREGLTGDRLKLRIREPEKNPREYLVLQEVTTLGKSPSSDLKMDDPFCSDTHAKLIVKGGRIILFDLNSKNGSFLNGVKIKEADLEEGMKLRLGQTEIEAVLVSEEKKVAAIKADSFGPMVGSSSKMAELYQLIQQVAPTDATVCIFGETGTGKELVARALHDLSPRRLKNWVALNCGAISGDLIESELFGHEKGAFTGAYQQRKGAFEQAQGGTLFLDEIGELPIDLQPKLLRVLETGKFRRVGGNQEYTTDLRVVCATHRDISRLVSEGKFREDLFFRLYVFPLFLPPLRERREDILKLAEYFLKDMSPSSKKSRLHPDAVRFLERQEWKGNIRELKNSIQRAVVLSKNGEIGVDELTLPKFPASADSPNTSNLEQLERELIEREIRSNGGNRIAVAKALGIAKSTLYEKLKKYGIA